MTSAPCSGVTVLMPVHGSAPFLEEALLSTLGNTVDVPMQVLVVLDRPMESVLELLKDPRFSEVESVVSEQPGLIPALNLGLLTARFDLVARMDADDVMVEGRLQLQVDRMLAEPELVVLGGQVDTIDEAGEKVGNRRYTTDSGRLPTAMRIRNQFAHPAVMMRRKAALEAGGYKTAFLYAEDYELWLRMMQVGRVANLRTTVLKYRLHAEQISASRSAEMAEATYLAQWAARRRSRGQLDTPLPWQVGTNPIKRLARLTRHRVRLFSKAARAAQKSWGESQYLLGVLWALAALQVRPVYACRLFHVSRGTRV